MWKTSLACLLLSAAILSNGCGSGLRNVSDGGIVKTLIIRWQRLVSDDGKTCDRCGNTEQEVRKAAETLKKGLGPMGIHVSLIQRELTPEECEKDISESNRIWIGDRALEDWLGANAGMSPCESCCSALGEKVECRTVSVDGNTYETVPAELIVKAGLLAASEIIRVPSQAECCPTSCRPGEAAGKCCPK